MSWMQQAGPEAPKKIASDSPSVSLKIEAKKRSEETSCTIQKLVFCSHNKKIFSFPKSKGYSQLSSMLFSDHYKTIQRAWGISMTMETHWIKSKKHQWETTKQLPVPATQRAWGSFPVRSSQLEGWLRGRISNLSGEIVACFEIVLMAKHSIYSWLVVYYPSEKYESVGVTIPNIWKNHPNVPNHQPDSHKNSHFFKGLRSMTEAADSCWLRLWKCFFTVFTATPRLRCRLKKVPSFCCVRKKPTLAGR